MPYTAYTPDEDDIHFASQASGDQQYECIDCHADAEHVRGHVRNLPDGDSTTVRSYFRYSNCGHGTVSDPSASTGGGGGGGEDDLHKRRKRAALQEALNRFPAAEYGTEVQIGSKRGDAVLEFDSPHETYGKGLVIEYQHKNESKDIEATQTEYAKNEYTTVWLWDEQFSFTSSIPEIDLFGGSVYTPWPDAVPEQNLWRGRGRSQILHEKWEKANSRGLTDSVVPANVLKHWILPTPEEYWRNSDWNGRFRDENTQSTRDYRLQAAIGGSPSSVSVPATVVRHWVWPTPADYWKQTGWINRFRTEISESTSDYIAQAAVPRTHSTRNDEVTFPPNVVDALEYHRASWYQLFTPRDDGIYAISAAVRNKSREEVNSRKLEIDFAPIFDMEFWLDAYRTGVADRPSHGSGSVDRPMTVFDDVQCYSCGNFQYAKSAGESCPNCGAEYDWIWNLATDRVSPQSLPDFVNEEDIGRYGPDVQ